MYSSVSQKWNGDSRPSRTKGPVPKGDPRDKINRHNRASAKEEIRKSLIELELVEQEELDSLTRWFECEGLS